MTDEDAHPEPHPATPGEAEAGWQLIEEQKARIAALRAAVLAGRVDEDTFDYAAFFGGKPGGDAPGS